MKSIQPPSNLQKSYIVCSTGRSGSTLLCKTLEQLGCCGNPEEFFHNELVKPIKQKNDPNYFIDYCNSIFEKGLTSNGVFGMKMHWWQLIDFLRLARQLPSFQGKEDLEILQSVFPNPKFIYIWRRDMSQQAISTVIALQTKQWVKPIDVKDGEKLLQSSQGRDLNFQPLTIYKWEQSFEDQNRRWRNFFKDNFLEHYELVYENFVVSFEQEMASVIDYLDLDLNLITDGIEMPTQKQANEINQQFLWRYKLIPKLAMKIAQKLKLKFKN
jgi:trehalose 2-sulfotransferase